MCVKLGLPPSQGKAQPIMFEQNRQSSTKWQDTRKSCTMTDFMINTPKQIIFKLSMTYKLLFKLSMTHTQYVAHMGRREIHTGYQQGNKTENTWKTKE